MFEYRRPARWCPFLICSNYTVSGSVELMHSMVNTFFIQILSHGGLPGRSMILERDKDSNGWVAFEGIYDSVKYEFDRLRVCFKCPDVGALDDGSFQGWFVNRAADGAEPDWGTATMRCLSHWERE